MAKLSTKTSTNKFSSDMDKAQGAASDKSEMNGNLWLLNQTAQPEPLRSELRKYLIVDKVGCHEAFTIKHPLIVSELYYGPDFSAHVHCVIDNKSDIIAKAKKKGDWETVLYQYEKAFLFDAYVKYAQEYSDKQYWTLLAHVWSMQESMWQNRKLYLQLFSSERPGREHLMLPEERRAYKALPETIDVYRGYSGSRGKGQSWTTDRNVAEWFAKRWLGMGFSPVKVVSGQLRKADVLAYFTRRKGSEVVADPTKVAKQRSEIVS